CPDNSCISEGAKRYGDFAIGVVPGTRSMRNSTCHCGGNPDKSSGNTSSNSHTTDISLNLGSSSFALFNALVIPTARKDNKDKSEQNQSKSTKKRKRQDK
ncbi:hypothetical protein Tco_0159280, partial [Tanacetum coccineum]